MSTALYTLYYRGEEMLSCDDLPYLERGLMTLPETRSTYIQFNESGVKQYETTKGENDEKD